MGWQPAGSAVRAGVGVSVMGSDLAACGARGAPWPRATTDLEQDLLSQLLGDAGRRVYGHLSVFGYLMHMEICGRPLASRFASGGNSCITGALLDEIYP